MPIIASVFFCCCFFHLDDIGKPFPLEKVFPIQANQKVAWGRVWWIERVGTVVMPFLVENCRTLTVILPKLQSELWWVRFVHDCNAPAHTAVSVQHCFHQKRHDLLTPPPLSLSPDLIPCDFPFSIFCDTQKLPNGISLPMWKRWSQKQQKT